MRKAQKPSPFKTFSPRLGPLVGALTLFGCSASGSPSEGGLVSGGTGGTISTSGGTGGSGVGGSAGTLSVGGTGGGVATCGTDGVSGTLRGTVYDPAGKVPLYNVVVYVPVDANELPPITEGASCDKCAGREARALAVAVTDAAGNFVLEDVPGGTNVPLVIEVGKWRRVVTIPSVAACEDNLLTDPELTRLPRNQSEGHLPKIALSTGHSDALECLLRKIGIDDTEFTTEADDGRVNLYYGCPHGDSNLTGANHFSDALGGASFSRAASTLYSDLDRLMTYDMVVLSCEGNSCDDEKLDYIETMKAYGDAGGRILFDHMHFRWLVKSDNAWEQVGTFSSGDDFPSPFTFSVETGFPKGEAFADWLVAVDASPTRGELSILAAQQSAQEAKLPLAQRWVYTDDPSAVQYMTINTPVEEAENEAALCGRLVHTDLHVTAGAGSDFSDQGTPFPEGCTTSDLTPQEKALEFILFDLSACVQKEDAVPVPPVIVR